MKISVSAVLLITAIFSLLCIFRNAEAADSHYWDLGVGSYGAIAGDMDPWSGMTDLDRARLGWVYVCFGNEPASKEETQMLNRFLAMNPDLKIMVRLWPILNLGRPENSNRATFLDYFYKPGVKEQLLREIYREIHSVLDDISRPENVIGFSFLEELPDHFSDNGLRITDPNALPWGVKYYRKEMESELGKDFKWDERARRWWCGEFMQALNEINQYIKKESGGKLVFVYLATGYDTLDWAKPVQDGTQPNLLRFYWRDVIKPGTADGFFAYPNNQYIWNRYLDLARENNWLFFSQLPQPSSMRLSGWNETVRLAETKVPQNLGYFLFIIGKDAENAWNDDPAIDPNDNFYRVSIRTHYRQYLARHNVGMNIVNRYLQPEVQIDYDLSKVNFAYGVQAFVRNTRDATWFVNPDEAVLKNVKVTLSLPPDMFFNQRYSQPSTIVIDRLAPQETRSILWWPSGKGQVNVSEQTPVTVTVEAPDVEKTVARWTLPSHILISPSVTTFRRSGETWNYIMLHGPDTPAPVKLECLEEQATIPAVQVNDKKIVYLGTLIKGQTLVIDPGRKAVLIDKEHPAGQDVSDRLGGGEISVTYGINKITYTDMDAPSPVDKMRFSLQVEGKKQ